MDLPSCLPSPSPDASPSFLPGDIVDGKYLVEEILGTGGMGVVLAARHMTLESEVAIKVLLPKFHKDGIVRERFLREARAAANLKSRHVTRILDVGCDRLNAPYIVMERLRGADLEALLQQHGPLEERVAVDYVMQACEALSEAHATGIVHRDLKPENLFLDQDRCIKVLDFGISKLASDPKILTGTADLMGTPHFMAPEQFKSARDVTARADVWALGAILYRLLTNALPFDGKDFIELCAKIMTYAPTPLDARRSFLTPAVSAVVRRCLEKDPSQRYANAYELRQALRAAIAPATGTSSTKLAFAATLPLDAVTALATPVAATGPSKPTNSSNKTNQTKPKRRWRGVFFALGAIGMGLVTFGATHHQQVRAYGEQKVAPTLQTEMPATETVHPLDAPASSVALTSAPEPPALNAGPTKLARAKTSKKRAPGIDR